MQKQLQLEMMMQMLERMQAQIQGVQVQDEVQEEGAAWSPESAKDLESYAFTEKTKWAKYDSLAFAQHRDIYMLRKGLHVRCKCNVEPTANGFLFNKHSCVGGPTRADGAGPQMPCYPPPFHIFLNYHLLRIEQLTKNEKLDPDQELPKFEEEMMGWS